MTCPDCERLEKRVEELEEALAERDKLIDVYRGENERLKRLIGELADETEELKRRLDKSGDPTFVKPKRRKSERRKSGRRKGHRGTSRRRPGKVDERKMLAPLEICPDCGHKLSGVQEIRKRWVEELVLPRLHTTEYGIPRSYCPNCDKIVEPSPPNVLPNRRLGIRAMCYITYLREELRLPINMVQKHLENLGIGVSEATVENICTDVAESLEPYYQSLKEELRESKATNNDETGKRIDGGNWWQWVFVNRDAAVFHTDRRRSSGVMIDFYGEDPVPVLGSDCYPAYNPFEAVKQRCWAHLLRDTSELESSEGRLLHESLKGLHTTAQYLDRGPPSAREVMARYCEGRLQNLAGRDWSDPEVRTIAKRIKKHRGEWFTFVRYPEVESTNNRAERALRPYVVFRKIIGGHRSLNGAKKHDILRSTLETCKLRKQNFMDFLETWLKQSATS